MIHVLIVSFNAQGHINPSLRLAKRIASEGILVTFSSTADVGQKLRATNKSGFTEGEPVPVGKGYVRCDFFSDGWDLWDPRRQQLDEYLTQLKAVGPGELAALVRRQRKEGRPVGVVVGNPFVPWVVDVASDMGIRCGVLWVQSCAVFAVYFHIYKLRAVAQKRFVDHPLEEPQNDTIELPGVPTLERVDIPSFLVPNSTFAFVGDEILKQFENLSETTFILVNSFTKLENEVIKALSPTKRLIPVGPLVDIPDTSHSMDSMVKSDLHEVANDCIQWLNHQNPSSVVYVSVGSVVQMSKEEVEEMAWGLKGCKKPFLWVVRDETRPLLPPRFLEAVEDQGLIVKWSPQNGVLNHPSTACFLTHCGWNSTLESIVAGVPVIAFPHWGDQPTNAKFLVDVIGVGVYLGSKKFETSTPSFTRDDLKKSIIAVTKGKDAKEIKRKNTIWKETALGALAEGGSAHRNIQAFLEEIGHLGSVCAPGNGKEHEGGRILN